MQSDSSNFPSGSGFEAACAASTSGYGFGHRHIQATLMFLVMFILYSVRTAMSIAILAMVDKTNNSTEVTIFDWDKKTQDVILSSFYWGYALLQIPAGVLAFKFGAWVLISSSLIVNCVACLSIPWLVKIGGWKMMCACRMLMGITQGFLFPCLHTLIGKWAPVSERGRFTFFVYCGLAVGTVLSQPISGILAEKKGWPCIFYTSGLTTLLIGALWLVLGSSSPDKHKRIKLGEKEFIQGSLGAPVKNKNITTPWKEILTSGPTWTVWITHILLEWTFIIMLVEMPTYLKRIYMMDITQSGFLCALPYILMWLTGLCASILNDYFLKNDIMSTLASRKLWNGIGIWIPAVFLLVLGTYPPDTVITTIIMITIITGLVGTTNSGFMLNYMDLSNNYAGILMAIGNCASNLFGIAAPISSGFILNGHESDRYRWQIVFLLAAAMVFLSNLVFILFSTTKEQPWNDLNGDANSDIEMDDIAEKNKNSKMDMYISEDSD